MGTLKWKNDENWETFYYGALENIKADLRNITVAINNLAAAIRRRCCRDKNLSDVYSAEESRTNLGLIGDCSDESKMGISPHYHDSYHLVRKKNLSDVYDTAESRINLELINDCSALAKAPHHHDSRYDPLIEQEANERETEDGKLKSRIHGLLSRLRGMRQCHCGSGGGGDEPSPPPEGGYKSGQLFWEQNYGNAYEPPDDEDLVWYDNINFDMSESVKVRIELTVTFLGNGAVGFSVNGNKQAHVFNASGIPEQFLMDPKYSIAHEPETQTASYGPFQLNVGHNDYHYGLDGNNKLGIQVKRANVKVYIA